MPDFDAHSSQIVVDDPASDHPAAEAGDGAPAAGTGQPASPAADTLAAGGGGPDREVGDADLARLRELLFSREMAQLEHLRALLEDPQVTTHMVSDVLAEAFRLRSGKGQHLSLAMEPLVDDIVKKTLNTKRDEFVTALSPLMGPTIRKSIAESFRSMVGNFTKSVEMAFSWKGLRWRLQALRSGKPFSEIVMLNTLVYRVEQLFFIHKKTGLVISHITGESVEAQDADMVSAMLTAIQDFVRDCFAGGKEEDLHSLQMGEFTIHIETGGHAYLACVLRGTPPAGFHEQLRATLDLMHIDYAEELTAFNGDTAPFVGAVRHLETCLLSHYAEDKKISPLGKVLVTGLLIALFAGVGGLVYLHRRAGAEQAAVAARREAFSNAMRGALGVLRAEPGLMVVDVEEKSTAPWNILVLKDGLARPPEEVLREKGINPAVFATRVVPFISYDPSLVVRRVRESIQPPDTVSMVFDDEGTLTFTGTAPMAWIVATREDARAIPGVERVDVSGVRDPMMAQISAMIAEVEGTVIEFPLGRDTPRPNDMPKLKKAIDTLVELENITKRMGFSASLTIYGHADALGDPKRNYEISQSRARTVAGMLYAKGSSMPVAIYGMGADYPRDGQSAPAQKENPASRRIELRVHFALSPSASPEMFQR